MPCNTEEERELIEDDDYLCEIIDERYHFLQTELLKSLALIGHEVTPDQMKALEEIYSEDVLEWCDLDVYNKFFESFTSDDIARFDMSFWDWRHVYYLFYRLNPNMPRNTPGHQFLIKVFGEFAYRLVRWAPDHLQQYCADYFDIDADGTSYIDRWQE
jgi:hypothetical protein